MGENRLTMNHFFKKERKNKSKQIRQKYKNSSKFKLLGLSNIFVSLQSRKTKK